MQPFLANGGCLGQRARTAQLSFEKRIQVPSLIESKNKIKSPQILSGIFCATHAQYACRYISKDSRAFLYPPKSNVQFITRLNQLLLEKLKLAALIVAVVNLKLAAAVVVSKSGTTNTRVFLVRTGWNPKVRRR